MALSQKHPEPEPTVIDYEKLTPEQQKNWDKLFEKMDKARRGEIEFVELE